MVLIECAMLHRHKHKAMPPLETACINSNSSVNKIVVRTSIYHLCFPGFKTQSAFGAQAHVCTVGALCTLEESIGELSMREEIHCSSLNVIATEIAGA